ncbi:polysaccharide biosynthesis tyrosine autokinase [Cellulomonas sp. PhB143]|uniref:polysaccharide biosynthesis tyrosine autokinase n=1 Tax=Cellulomonas sp. PhB143 TaxID=2485186 RepID=UPI000F4A8A5A|nr:polysaccharide biosynthesis tyrosine autokinase [Cellulomonas sp. PhB143]ROS78672.1 capsular exopolysaccharide synthesis family protein [Cellulomonas sp. PhB143]
MSAGEFLSVLRRNWIVVLGGLILGTAVALVLTQIVTPTYKARSELLAVSNLGATATDVVQGNAYSQSQILSISALATRPVVLDPVIDDLGLDETADTLAKSLTVSTVTDTSIVSIVSASRSPDEAADIANAVAQSLSGVTEDLGPKLPDGGSALTLDTIREAESPTVPASPNTKLWTVLGAMLGLVMASLAVAAREGLDTKVRGPETAEEILEAPRIGLTARVRRTNLPSRREDVGPLLVSGNPMLQESFLQIQTNLNYVEVGRAHKTFALTSAIAGEGKSFSAINLALTFAAGGLSTCLVELDLRRPSIGRYLGLDSTVGLSTVLIGGATSAAVTQSWGPTGLQVIVAGELPPNPAELLASPAFAELLGELGQRFERVVLDCPPLVPVTDAAIIAKEAGGILMVVGSGRVDRRELAQAAANVRAVQAPIQGFILTRATGDAVTPGPYSRPVGGSAQRHARRKATVGSGTAA